MVRFDHFMYTMVHKKTGHCIIGDNFVKCEPIFTLCTVTKKIKFYNKTPCNISTSA